MISRNAFEGLCQTLFAHKWYPIGLITTFYVHSFPRGCRMKQQLPEGVGLQKPRTVLTQYPPSTRCRHDFGHSLRGDGKDNRQKANPARDSGASSDHGPSIT